MKILKPSQGEYADYYKKYIDKTNTDDPIKELMKSAKEIKKLLSGLSGKQLKYRYAEGKWSIKEIIVHLMDAERVFCYRALRFARNDNTELSGFDENKWVPETMADSRKIKSLLNEYMAVRNSTVAMFQNLDKELLSRIGKANGNLFSVRALLYITLGHERHHLQIIHERYLKK